MEQNLHAALGFVCDYCSGLQFKYDLDSLLDNPKSPNWDKPNICIRCGKKYKDSQIISMCALARLPNGNLVNPKDINPKFQFTTAHECGEHGKRSHN